MHQLTIDHDAQPGSVSDHADFTDAHQALLKYVVGADYYLRPVQNSTAHTSYELLRLADLEDPRPCREPQVAGVATIEVISESELPVAAPYFVACDAQTWITDHASKWLHGSSTDPGYHYPMSVLTIARGEAHFYLRAGALLSEAASLAGADKAIRPAQATVETLRRNAVQSSGHLDTPDTPAAIAAAVQQHQPEGTTKGQTAMLIWYYALLLWGVSAP
jgi:hypothetical protein